MGDIMKSLRVDMVQLEQILKKGPPHPGLVPQSGDWNHPGRWIKAPPGQEGHPGDGPPVKSTQAREHIAGLSDADLASTADRVKETGKLMTGQSTSVDGKVAGPLIAAEQRKRNRVKDPRAEGERLEGDIREKRAEISRWAKRAGEGQDGATEAHERAQKGLKQLRARAMKLD